jgi:hypothetical protein
MTELSEVKSKTVVTCVNTIFHASDRGKKLDLAYRAFGFLWTINYDDKKVSCSSCIHEDDLQDEFELTSDCGQGVKTLWETCQHSKVEVPPHILCRTCLVAQITPKKGKC